MNSAERKMLSDIGKKKDLEMLLPKYAGNMMGYNYEYSLIVLSYHYYTMLEMIRDKEVDDVISDYIDRLNQIIRRYITEKNFDASRMEEDLQAIHEIREEIIHKMRILTYYTDAFQIYEYIINRVEPKFDSMVRCAGTGEFTQQIMQFIFNDKDNMVVNSKIQMIMAQLPMRITKNRFYDMLSNALSIYNGSERSSLDAFVSMIRGVATLDKPEGYDVEYPDLVKDYQALQEYNYDSSDERNFVKIQSTMEHAVDAINKSVNGFLQLEEIVNGLLSIMLSVSYYNEENDTINEAKKLITYVNDAFLEKKDVDPLAEESLLKLEGKQEAIYEDLSMYESLLFGIRMEHDSLIKATMQEQAFERLNMMEKLHSNSLFVDLKSGSEDEQLADTSYIFCLRDELIEEFSQLFSECNREVKRAIMAAVIGNLPVTFSNSREVNEYITYSLENCDNRAEMAACNNIIYDLMRDSLRK